MKERIRTNAIETRGLLVSKGWLQAVAMVVLFGFFVMGLLAYRTYAGEAPIPEQVLSPERQVLFTGDDVIAGQGIFLRNGLMEYGSVFGHGAYLGPDFTADYLRRAAFVVSLPRPGLGPVPREADTMKIFKTNRYDHASGALAFTADQPKPSNTSQHYSISLEPTTRYGLRPGAISDPKQIKQLIAFFAWSAWVPPPYGRDMITPIQITGLPSRWSETTLPPRRSSGASYRSLPYWAGSGSSSPLRAMEFSGLAWPRASDADLPLTG